MAMLRSALIWRNAWRIRIVALSLIVLLIGLGSQVLVSTLAADAESITVKVTISTASGRMADGDWTHIGACGVSAAQFPAGTMLVLYNADNMPAYQCTAEDTNADTDDGHISLIMPGDAAAAIRWGVRYLAAHVLRLGWGPDGPPTFTITGPHSLSWMHRVKLHRVDGGT